MQRVTSLFALLALACALASCGAVPEVTPLATTTVGPNPLAAVGVSPSATAAFTPSPAPTRTALTTPTVPPSLTPTTVPSVAPSVMPTTAPSVAPSLAARSVPSATSNVTAAAKRINAEILFLRGGRLMALDVAGGSERMVADGVHSFAATPDGRLLALTRGDGAKSEIWLVGRDGTNLRQLTTNNQAESTLSWAPNGRSLVYTAGPKLASRTFDWQDWAKWCGASEARQFNLENASEIRLGAGCEPVISPDGRRIAFTTAPTAIPPGRELIAATNAISVVNRQGENGWPLALAEQGSRGEGFVVYRAAWAPDGSKVAYQRFLGYQSLVDLNLTEASNSFKRAGLPLGTGGGWMLAPIYAPNGAQLAMIEQNSGDARGFSGYDIWKLTVLNLSGQQEVALTSGTQTLQSTTVDSLPRVTAATWAPDSASLAVTLPTGWKPGLSNNKPVFSAQGPGELWRWRPGSPPEQRLAEGLDFASPLLWLPPL